MGEESLNCSFCQKSRKNVTKMIVGATKVAICNECIKLCVEILDEDAVKVNIEKVKQGDSKSLNPVTIKEHLDEYVIGQDAAKTVLAVAVSNHYKRILTPPKDFELEKSNVLLLGQRHLILHQHQVDLLQSKKLMRLVYQIFQNLLKEKKLNLKDLNLEQHELLFQEVEVCKAEKILN